MRAQILTGGMVFAILATTGTAMGQSSPSSAIGAVDQPAIDSSLLPTSGWAPDSYGVDVPANPDFGINLQFQEPGPQPSDESELQYFNQEPRPSPSLLEGGESGGALRLDLPTQDPQ
jgi:hypothetical protein